MHNTEIIGNVGRDAESRFTPSGAQVTSFSVAVNEKYTASSGEKVSNTIWYKVNFWGTQAETANQYVKKGMKIFVSGRLQADPATGAPRIWNAQDGSPRTSFELTGREMEFLSFPDRDEAGAQSDAGDMLPPEDGIPF